MTARDHTHPARSVVISLPSQDRPGAKMHVAVAAFTTGAPWIPVQTLCGRNLVPGTVFGPRSWYTNAHLARTHETGHCHRCLDITDAERPSRISPLRTRQTFLDAINAAEKLSAAAALTDDRDCITAAAAAQRAAWSALNTYDQS